MKYSLMTTSMLFEMLEKLKNGLPMEEVKLEYLDMLRKTAELEIPAVEVTSLELELFGLDFVKNALNENHLEPACLVHLDQYATTDPEQSAQISAKAIQRVQDAISLGTKSDSKDTASLLNAVSELHLTYDTGNMLLKGEDTLSYYRHFKNRVSHIHLKDMTYAEYGDSTVDGRKMTATPHGEGMIDFPNILKELRTDGYDGYLVIEYVGSGDHFTNIKKAKGYLDLYK